VPLSMCCETPRFSNLICENKSLMSGYVYILTNSAMPRLVKIGWTNINPDDRAKQLHTTGVPAPFRVYGYVQVDNPKEIEKTIHAKLSKFRFSKSREFFEINPEKAVEIIESVSGEYELKRQKEAARKAAEAERRATEAQLKAAEAERRRIEQENRKRQEQFDRELFSFLEMACEKAEEKVEFRFYRNLERCSFLLALFTFIFWLFSFKYFETDILITIGIVWILFGLAYLISSSITTNEFRHLEKHVYSTMEELCGPIWQEHTKKCVDKLYEKYNCGKSAESPTMNGMGQT
jgi:hypothetical protein